MGFSKEDTAAIGASARRLGLDPHSFGALMELESNIDPNKWGGAGGKYLGLIQFGPDARKEVGLPGGRMTVQQQLPYVERYFQQRGYKPGKDPADNIMRAYRTVLVGNPWQSGTDSFGTNSDRAAARMRPGGDLYKIAAQKLGSVPVPTAGTPAPAAPGAPAAAAPGATPAAAPLPATTTADAPPVSAAAVPPASMDVGGMFKGVLEQANERTRALGDSIDALRANRAIRGGLAGGGQNLLRMAASPGFLQRVIQLSQPLFQQL